jgi:hypothetical protein
MSKTASSKKASYSGLMAAICVGATTLTSGAALAAGIVGGNAGLINGGLACVAGVVGFCAQALLAQAINNKVIILQREFFMTGFILFGEQSLRLDKLSNEVKQTRYNQSNIFTCG